MEEILYELRGHSAGLNCGRWDYLFSYIKKFAQRPEFIVPDRAQVPMTAAFMRAYTLSCIEACHKRGAFAMGGMAAYIPVKSNSAANEAALQKVREDKRREATDGHDGTWVAHPGLVPIAMEEFDKVLGEKANQIDRRRDDVSVTPEQLVEVPKGTITDDHQRAPLRVRQLGADAGGHGESHRRVVRRREKLSVTMNEQVRTPEQRISRLGNDHRVVVEESVQALEHAPDGNFRPRHRRKGHRRPDRIQTHRVPAIERCDAVRLRRRELQRVRLTK